MAHPLAGSHRCAGCRGGVIPNCAVPGCVDGVITFDDEGRLVSRETPSGAFDEEPVSPRPGLRRVGDVDVSY